VVRSDSNNMNNKCHRGREGGRPWLGGLVSSFDSLPLNKCHLSSSFLDLIDVTSHVESALGETI
jgi:hypothetical protein